MIAEWNSGKNGWRVRVYGNIVVSDCDYKPLIASLSGEVVYSSNNMTLQEFKQSLYATAPPGGINQALKALWHDAKGEWDTAHEVAQSVDSPDGARVHAYLHRKEGDHSNAMYWYRRANMTMFEGSLEEEWNAITNDLLVFR